MNKVIKIVKIFFCIIKLVNISALIIFTFILPQSSWAFDASDKDKQRHMALSALISSGTYLSLRNNEVSKTKAGAVAILTALSVGYIKEYLDRSNTDQSFNSADMQANTVGALSGVLIPMVFTF